MSLIMRGGGAQRLNPPRTPRVLVVALFLNNTCATELWTLISHTYKERNHPIPSGIRCHSYRSVSTSWATLREVPLEDNCATALWASPGSFSRFYRVNVATSHPFGLVLFANSSNSNL